MAYVEGTAGNDNLVGGTGADRLVAGHGNDLLSGREGNDRLSGGQGYDLFVFEPGHGRDTIEGIVNAGDGGDFSAFGQSAPTWSELIAASTNTDAGVRIDLSDFGGGMIDITARIHAPGTADHGGTLRVHHLSYGVFVGLSQGTDGDDYLPGGAGDDTLIGGAGDDWLSGGWGADCYVFAPGHGADRIYAFGESEGDHIDLGLFGQSAPTWAELLASATGLDGGVRFDLSAFGGGTIDVFGITRAQLNGSHFEGLNADPTAVDFDTERSGGRGADTLYGAEDNDSLRGGGGDDLLAGRQGRDRLEGNDGTDRLFGGGDADTLVGGTGDDLLDGWNGADRLEGEDGHDILLGWEGDDTLIGGGGRDVLKGGVGADSIEAGTGNDFVLAGKGNDVVRGGSGSDWVEGDDGNDTIHGGDGNPDVLAGQRGNDRLYGDAGNDRLWGGGGNDTLLGGADGDSALAGGEGSDSIDGGAGDDRLLGGPGADTLVGGAGDDVFRFNSWERGRDVIRDYGNGDDVIQLNLPKGNTGSGLSFRAEAGGTLVTGGNIEILVQGPDAAGLVLSDVEIV